MKTLKNLILILVLFSVTLLSSCMFPGPHHGHGFSPPGPPHMERHGNNGHHRH